MSDAWPEIKGRDINSLWIPGTHDTFTYDLDPESISDATDTHSCGPPVMSWAASNFPELIIKWAMTQTHDIVSQLDMGFRLFDLRPNYDGTNIYFQHGCVRTRHTMSTYLDQIASWLSGSGPDSKEVLILFFSDYTGNEWDAKAYTLLADLVNKSLGSFLYGSNHATGKVTMHQITEQQGPKVLCVMEAPDHGETSLSVPGAEKLIKRESFLQGTWPNVNEVAPLLVLSDKYVNERSSEKVLLLQGILTAQAADGIGQTLQSGSSDVPSILLRWEVGALNTNDLFLNHVATNYWDAPHPNPTASKADSAPRQNRSGMILMLDNPHKDEAVFILSLNFGPPEVPVPVFNYGSSVGKYNFLTLECDVEMPDNCREGYSGRAYHSLTSLSCHGLCCKGQDCGCHGAQMEFCE